LKPSADGGLFLVLAAYVDESGNDKFFTLSCLVAAYGAWVWFELDWKQCLDEKNAELKQQDRPLISRYHAADASSQVNEFAGWTPAEVTDFFKKLLGVFRKHITNTVGYTINLREFVEVFPETANDPKKPAYGLLLKYLMIEIGNNILAREKWNLVSIIHDRTKGYNQTLLDAFDAMIVDETFAHRERFSSITPMSWEHCIPLQPADMVAYENFKEVEGGHKNRLRRRSLQALLDCESTFGGKCVEIPLQGIREIKEMFEAAKAEKTGKK
jgi:hypothetical protein